MEHRHFTPYLLGLALSDDPDVEALERIMECCPQCREASRTFNDWCRKIEHPDPRVVPEYGIAPDLLREILLEPPHLRLEVIKEDYKYHAWGLCRLLISESFEGRFHSPELYDELAQLAVELSSLLDEGFYGAAHVIDLKARALANLGNAHRKLRELRAAGEALEEAEKWWSRGTRRPQILGEILSFRASLERQQGNPEGARVLIQTAIAQYRQAEDRGGELRAWVSLSNILIDLLKFEAVVAVTDDVLPQLEQTGADLRVRTAAVFNQATACLELGNYDRMQALIPRIPTTDPLCALKRDWLIANVQAIGGEIETAVATYHRVRQGYLDLNLGFDAALVTLELVLLHIVVGQDEAAYELAAEIFEVLKDDAIHAQAAEALIRFTRQARDRALSEQVVRDFRHYLRRAHSKPHLAWAPTAPAL